MLMHSISAFTQNDQRHQKFPSCIRRKGNYPLWWIVPNSQILSKAEIETAFSSLYTSSLQAYPIQCFRTNSNIFLLYYCRSTTYKQHSSIEIQWSIQKNPWSKEISQSNHNKTFSSSSLTRNNSTDYQGSQLTPKETFLHWVSTNQCNIRFRPNGNYSLWQATKSQSRIQSKETRQKMLFPISLFRIQPPRVLAWKFKLWEYSPNNFSYTLHEKMQRQITKDRKKNSCPSRLRLLRPQVYRILGRRRNRLYNRSKSYQPSKRNNSENKILPLQEKLGSSTVLLSTNDPFTHQMEKSPSFCGPTSPIAGRSRRKSSVKSIYNKRIWLQSYCNQSQVKTETCMELPQSKSKRCRTEYQRTKTQLSINKDSNSELYNKYCLSSNTSIFIQYCQLVQTPMSSKRVPLQDITDYSSGLDTGTSEINKNWTQEYTQVPDWLPTSKTILSTYEKDRKYENLKNLSRLKNIVSSQAH